MDVFVAEICSHIREARLRIDAFAVPGEHTVGDEGVTKIVYAGACASWSRFEFCPP